MSAIEDLGNAIDKYNIVFAGDPGWVHGKCNSLGVQDVPVKGEYNYIAPSRKHLKTFTEASFVSHGCMDWRVVKFTHQVLKINGDSRIMTSSAGGAEQNEYEERQDAIVGYLSAVRNASIKVPEMLLLVHAGGSDEVGECGGFMHMAGKDFVNGHRNAGDVQDQIVSRAKLTRDLVWAKSRNRGGAIDVACVVVDPWDQATLIDKY